MVQASLPSELKSEFQQPFVSRLGLITRKNKCNSARVAFIHHQEEAAQGSVTARTAISRQQ